MRSEVRALLDELVVDQPEAGVDVDRLIRRGRRRDRVHTAGFAATGVVLAAGLTAGVLALRPGVSVNELPPSGPSSTPASVAPSAGTFPEASQLKPTDKSKQLANQLQRLVPEINEIPGAQKSDGELFGSDGTPEHHLMAGSVWTYPATGGRDMVSISVEVGLAHEVPPICDGMSPGVNKCTEVRRLPDGSTAYIHNYMAAGGHQYEVRLVRPDGTWVFVGSSAQRLPGSTHDAVLGADRVLEVARQITIEP